LKSEKIFHLRHDVVRRNGKNNQGINTYILMIDIKNLAELENTSVAY